MSMSMSRAKLDRYFYFLLVSRARLNRISESERLYEEYVEQAILAPVEPMLVLSCIAFFQTILAMKVAVFPVFAK